MKISGWLAVMLFLVTGFQSVCGKERLTVFGVNDRDSLFSKDQEEKIKEYIFGKMQSSGVYVMIPDSEIDSAVEQAMEKTRKASRKEDVDDSCSISLAAALSPDSILMTDIFKRSKGRCSVILKKFDVEKKAGTEAWEGGFNCSESGLYDAVDYIVFSIKKKMCGLSREEQGLDAIKGLNKEKCEDTAKKKNTGVKKKETPVKTKHAKGKWSGISPSAMKWDEAVKYCENLREKGRSDWRLPTLTELRTLIKNCPSTQHGGTCRAGCPCPHFGNCGDDGCGGCPPAHGRYSEFEDSEGLWSASVKNGAGDDVWHVNFKTASILFIEKSESIRARCFR